MPHPNSSIILFDGVCNLCNRLVAFVIRRDRDARFRFAPLQSESGRRLLATYGLPPDALDTFVLIEGQTPHIRSDAALAMVRGLSGPWPLLGVFRLVPRPVRDAGYNWVARNRYRWFGRKEACMTPTPELQERFLP